MLVCDADTAVLTASDLLVLRQPREKLKGVRTRCRPQFPAAIGCTQTSRLTATLYLCSGAYDSCERGHGSLRGPSSRPQPRVRCACERASASRRGVVCAPVAPCATVNGPHDVFCRGLNAAIHTPSHNVQALLALAFPFALVAGNAAIIRAAIDVREALHTPMSSILDVIVSVQVIAGGFAFSI